MIYLLEDDNNIRELVVYTFNTIGMETEGFSTPSQFWTALEKQIPSIVLLDIMLPEEDGIQILKKLRAGAKTTDIPIILLTAKSSEYDKVIGLNSGADDYIPKPFGMMELISRVKALLRRTECSNDQSEFTLQNLYLSTSKHIVKADGKDILLSSKEFDILTLLFNHINTVVSRETIIENLWGNDFDGENRTIDLHIYTLRSKLLSAGNLIKTIRGVGYMLAERED